MSKCTKKWDGKDLGEMQSWLNEVDTKPFKASVWEDGTLAIYLPGEDYDVFAMPGESIEVVRRTPRTAI